MAGSKVRIDQMADEIMKHLDAGCQGRVDDNHHEFPGTGGKPEHF